MGKKLLVADDSLTIQKVIKLALSNDGYEIQTVSDGNEAIQSISLFRPDVVLVDIALPGKTAFEVKKTVNGDSELRKIPFVLMSSAFEKVDEAKVALLQFDGRLTKPFDPSHLRQVLNQAISMKEGAEGKKPLPPPPPSPAPNPFAASNETKFMTASNMLNTNPSAASSLSDRETGEIKLSDPIWSDTERTNPGFRMEDLPQSTPLSRPVQPMAMHVEEKVDAFSGSDSAADHDIKHLTESTVKMSGLDDLGGWNINESAKGPASGIPDIFSQDSGIPVSSQPMHSTPAPTQSTLSHYSRTPAPSSFTPTPSYSTAPSQPAPPPVELPSTAEIEEMVEKQVKAQLEEMMMRAIPDIAERVIKQEIKRLLDNLT